MIVRAGLSRRLFAGISYSTITIVVTLLGQVIAVPVFITQWGVDVYGEWLILTGTISLLTLLNLGVHSYVVNVLIAKHLTGDDEQGKKIFHSAIRLYLLLGSLGLLILIIVISYPEILESFNITRIPIPEASIILTIYGLIAIYGILGGLLMGIFRVIQQTPRQIRYGLFERIIFIFIPVIVALLGGSPLACAVWLGIFFVALTIIELIDISRRSPYPIGLTAGTWQVSKELIKPSLLFFAISVSSTVLWSGLTLIIANREGSRAVVIFNTALMLTNLVRTTINQALNVLWPEITGMSALPDGFPLLGVWHQLSIKLFTLFASLCASAIIVFGSDFIQVWTRGEVSVDELLILLLSVFLMVQSPAMVSTTFGLALNRPRDLAIISLTFVIGAFGMSWLLTSYFGINALAISLLIVQLLVLPWLTWMACKWTAVNLASFVNNVYIRFVPGLSLILITSIAVYQVETLWLRVIFLSIAGSLSILLAWWIGFTNPERKSLAFEVNKLVNPSNLSKNRNKVLL